MRSRCTGPMVVSTAISADTRHTWRRSPGAVGAHLATKTSVPSASCSFTERARPACCCNDLGVATTAFVPATR